MASFTKPTSFTAPKAPIAPTTPIAPITHRAHKSFNVNGAKYTVESLPTLETLGTLPNLNTLPSLSSLSSLKSGTNQQQVSPLTNYNDPTEVNSLADVVWNTIQKNTNLQTRDYGILSDIGDWDIPQWIPLIGQAPVAARAVTGTIDLIIDLIRNTAIAPISQGDAGAFGINLLNNVFESLDILANPVKGLVTDGPKGLIKGSVGRVNYDYDTGNLIADMLLEFVSDPFNWVTLGASGAAKQAGKAVVKESFQGATTQFIKKGGKIFLNEADDVAVAAFKKKLAKTVSYALRHGDDVDVSELVLQATKRHGKDVFTKEFLDSISDMQLQTLKESQLFNLRIAKGVGSIAKVSEGAESFIWQGTLATSFIPAKFIKSAVTAMPIWKHMSEHISRAILESYQVVTGIKDFAKVHNYRKLEEATPKVLEHINSMLKDLELKTLDDIAYWNCINEVASSDIRQIKEILEQSADLTKKDFLVSLINVLADEDTVQRFIASGNIEQNIIYFLEDTISIIDEVNLERNNIFYTIGCEYREILDSVKEVLNTKEMQEEIIKASAKFNEEFYKSNVITKKSLDTISKYTPELTAYKKYYYPFADYVIDTVDSIKNRTISIDDYIAGIKQYFKNNLDQYEGSLKKVITKDINKHLHDLDITKNFKERLNLVFDFGKKMTNLKEEISLTELFNNKLFQNTDDLATKVQSKIYDIKQTINVYEQLRNSTAFAGQRLSKIRTHEQSKDILKTYTKDINGIFNQSLINNPDSYVTIENQTKLINQISDKITKIQESETLKEIQDGITKLHKDLKSSIERYQKQSDTYTNLLTGTPAAEKFKESLNALNKRQNATIQKGRTAIDNAYTTIGQDAQQLNKLLELQNKVLTPSKNPISRTYKAKHSFGGASSIAAISKKRLLDIHTPAKAAEAYEAIFENLKGDSLYTTFTKNLKSLEGIVIFSDTEKLFDNLLAKGYDQFTTETINLLRDCDTLMKEVNKFTLRVDAFADRSNRDMLNDIIYNLQHYLNHTVSILDEYEDDIIKVVYKTPITFGDKKPAVEKALTEHYEKLANRAFDERKDALVSFHAKKYYLTKEQIEKLEAAYETGRAAYVQSVIDSKVAYTPRPKQELDRELTRITGERHLKVVKEDIKNTIKKSAADLKDVIDCFNIYKTENNEIATQMMESLYVFQTEKTQTLLSGYVSSSPLRQELELFTDNNSRVKKQLQSLLDSNDSEIIAATHDLQNFIATTNAVGNFFDRLFADNDIRTSVRNHFLSVLNKNRRAYNNYLKQNPEAFTDMVINSIKTFFTTTQSNIAHNIDSLGKLANHMLENDVANSALVKKIWNEQFSDYERKRFKYFVEHGESHSALDDCEYTEYILRLMYGDSYVKEVLPYKDGTNRFIAEDGSFLASVDCESSGLYENKQNSVINELALKEWGNDKPTLEVRIEMNPNFNYADASVIAKRFSNPNSKEIYEKALKRYEDFYNPNTPANKQAIEEKRLIFVKSEKELYETFKNSINNLKYPHTIVIHNGKNFDIPMIRYRAQKNDIFISERGTNYSFVDSLLDSRFLFEDASYNLTQTEELKLRDYIQSLIRALPDSDFENFLKPISAVNMRSVDNMLKLLRNQTKNYPVGNELLAALEQLKVTLNEIAETNRATNKELNSIIFDSSIFDSQEVFDMMVGTASDNYRQVTKMLQNPPEIADKALKEITTNLAALENKLNQLYKNKSKIIQQNKKPNRILKKIRDAEKAYRDLETEYYDLLKNSYKDSDLADLLLQRTRAQQTIELAMDGMMTVNSSRFLYYDGLRNLPTIGVRKIVDPDIIFNYFDIKDKKMFIKAFGADDYNPSLIKLDNFTNSLEVTYHKLNNINDILKNNDMFIKGITEFKELLKDKDPLYKYLRTNNADARSNYVVLLKLTSEAEKFNIKWKDKISKEVLETMDNLNYSEIIKKDIDNWTLFSEQLLVNRAVSTEINQDIVPTAEYKEFSRKLEDFTKLVQVGNELDETSFTSVSKYRVASLAKPTQNAIDSFVDHIENLSEYDQRKVAKKFLDTSEKQDYRSLEQLLSLSPEKIRQVLCTDAMAFIIDNNAMYNYNPKLITNLLARADELEQYGIKIFKDTSGGITYVYPSRDINFATSIDDVTNKTIFEINGETVDLTKLELDELDLNSDLSYLPEDVRNNIIEAQKSMARMNPLGVGSTYELVDSTFYKNVYNMLPPGVQKDMLPFELFGKSDMYNRRFRFNFTTFGSHQFKLKYNPYSPSDLLKNYANTYSKTSMRATEKLNYVEFAFDETFSINYGCLKDLNFEELQETLKNNPDFNLCIITKNDKGEFFLKDLKLNTEVDFQFARKNEAKVLPYHIYAKLFDVINSTLYEDMDPVTRNIMKLMYHYKRGYLSSIGTLMRNTFDTLWRNIILSDGDIPEAIHYTFESMKLYINYNKVLNEVRLLDTFGRINKQSIDKYFNVFKNPKMTREQFNYVHEVLNSGALVGEVQALEKYRLIQKAKQGLTPAELLEFNENKATVKNLFDLIQDANSTVENIQRLAGYMMLKDSGYNFTQAVSKIGKTHFNYDLKTARQKMLELVIPFYTFKINNLHYWAETIERNPWVASVMRDVMTPICDFDDTNQYELEHNKSLQYRILSGNIQLTDSGLTLKLNPSAMDAFQIMTNPLGQIYNSLFAPFQIGVEYASEQTRKQFGEKTKLVLQNTFNIYEKQNPTTLDYVKDFLNMVPYGGIANRTINGIAQAKKLNNPLPGLASSVFGRTNRFEPKTYTKKNYTRKGYSRKRKIYARKTYPRRVYDTYKRPYDGKYYPVSFRKAYIDGTLDTSHINNYRAQTNRLYHYSRFNRLPTVSIYDKLYTAKGKSRWDAMLQTVTPKNLKYIIKQTIHYK